MIPLKNTKIRLISINLILFFILLTFSNTAFPKELVCGIATGFPPYQFQKDGQVTGFDADVIRLIFSRLSDKFIFFQNQWDNVVNELRYGKIDFITGMEINETRNKLFDFTTDYYHRYDVVFIREDNKEIKKIEDLLNKIITGDRHSFVETYWKEKGIKDKIRIMQTESKEKSMQLLHSGKTNAAIMPKAVGLYLAKQIVFKVKILEDHDPGSPVAIAVKKGNHVLLAKIDKILQDLIEEGEIEKLYNKWF